MAQPTHSEIQVNDPILTNMLLGYQQADTRFVANRVFPFIPVDKQTFTYYTLTKKYWFLDELKSRTPGALFARSGYGVTSSTGYCNTWGLEHPIPHEARENNQMPMGLEQIGAKWLAGQSLIRRERAFATDFMATGVWGTDDNNATTDWDDFSAGDPFTDILTAKRTISNATGVDANTIVLGLIVHVAIQNHPDIIDRVKYNQIAGLRTVETALSALFDVQNYMVAKASYNSANEGQAMTTAAIIDDDCLVCYTTPTPGIFEASAGYTYTWAGGGGSGGLAPAYYEEKTKSHVLQISEAWDQKVAASDVGYFFADVV